MSKQELLKLFELLNNLYPHSPHHEKNEKVCLAWWYALKEYTYGEVRQAAIKQLQQSKFFPDVGELLQHLPKKVMSADDEQIRANLEKLKAKIAQIRAEHHELGRPSPGEALVDEGLHYDAWRGRYDE